MGRKPIPYWLYKLHGLNLEFTCEICGNYSYWGRRAYERHFKEFRHQHGMRCLNIPNTKAFAEVRTFSFFVWRFLVFLVFWLGGFLATRRSSIFVTGLMDTLHWALIPVKHTH